MMKILPGNGFAPKLPSDVRPTMYTKPPGDYELPQVDARVYAAIGDADRKISKWEAWMGNLVRFDPQSRKL
jgi:hypothetical protein